MVAAPGVAVMPAVAGPAPGGVTYHQVRKLIQGLAAKTRVLGMDIVEITPKADVNGITARGRAYSIATPWTETRRFPIWNGSFRGY